MKEVGSKLLSLVIVFLGLPSFMFSEPGQSSPSSYEELQKIKEGNLITLDLINKHVKYGEDSSRHH